MVARVESSLISVSSGSDGERVSVVGQDAPSGPDLLAFVAFEAGSVQAVAAFEVTDPSLCAGSVLLEAANGSSSASHPAASHAASRGRSPRPSPPQSPRPRPGRTTARPAKPPSADRARHARTVTTVTPTRSAIRVFTTPSAASTTPALGVPAEAARCEIQPPRPASRADPLSAPTRPQGDSPHHSTQPAI